MPDQTQRSRPSTARPAPPGRLGDASAFPAISDAEWEVMKVVWDRGPLAAGDVVRQLAESPPGHPARRWRPRTIKTLLSRLVRKGAVAATNGAVSTNAAASTNGSADAGSRAGGGSTTCADDDGPGGRRFLYAARVARDRVVRQESRSFLARVFDGSVAPALLHFLADARLTPDEVDQLRRTLDGQPAADASPPTGRRPSSSRPSDPSPGT